MSAALRWSWTVALLAAVLVADLTGCMSVPPTRHYALTPPVASVRPVAATSGPLLAITELDVDPAYEDPSIVYRPAPHRLERYHYHRWSASPGTLVTGFLRDALVESGCFRGVVDDVHPETTAVVSGRVLAFEEVDVSEHDWRAHVAIELALTDPTTGGLRWTKRYREEEPLTEQSPAGLAAGIERALARVTARSLPEILAAIEDHADPDEDTTLAACRPARAETAAR